MKPTKSILILLSLFLIFSCDDNSVEPLVCDEGLTNVEGVCTFVCDEGLTNVEGECTSLNNSEIIFPTTYTLSSPYPNPFNPTTTVQFSIPQSDLVSIKVYDIHGREVTTLVNDYLHTGYHTISWNGYKSTSGIYFIRMEGDEFVQTRKVMLLK